MKGYGGCLDILYSRTDYPVLQVYLIRSCEHGCERNKHPMSIKRPVFGRDPRNGDIKGEVVISG